MQDFEKLGMFYLGRVMNAQGKETSEPLLYESKNLTTHAVCVGMTGSGKTGLGIDIIEEAAIDKIPSIVIDPKGDMGNLLLSFPHLSPVEFRPWIDAAEAEKKGLSADEYAKTVADTWKAGLEKWGEGPDRIKLLRDSVEMVIYTPASQAGVPLSILSSFAAPPKEFLLDTGAMREKVLSTTSSLLGLLGINADPIKSREHILISTIIHQAWSQGKDLTIESLIHSVQKPPFDKIGALDIETFYPEKDRLALSVSLNNLLASPGFQAWMEGVPLDIKSLLYTEAGKPKVSIISIAHLSDSERMFFVTLLLNEFTGWMRRQSGTSSLRAILYMDEIFGYFPPIADPPSKLPMLTLLKQARAFGVGVVLATQNPVDLDYKGLSNCGTWFIGKLQTDRDKVRVLEGLKIASNGDIEADALDRMLALVGKRMFIMRSIHEKNPILFETRWTMSYLSGPMTLVQINSLTKKTDRMAKEVIEPSPKKSEDTVELKPPIPAGIPEFFVHYPKGLQPAEYTPRIAGIAKLHFVDSKNKIDVWEDICLIADSDSEGKNVNWNTSKDGREEKDFFEKEALPGRPFKMLPAGLMREKNYSSFEKDLATYLYQNQTLTIYQSPDGKLVSNVGESERDFRARIAVVLREKRDEMTQKIRDKYADKIATLTEKVRKAQEKLAQKQQNAGMQKTETWISVGATILGALFGKGVTRGTISQAGTSLRRAGKIGKENQDVESAEENLKASQQQLEDTQAALTKEMTEISTDDGIKELQLNTLVLKPRKSDISIEKVALVWC